MLPCMLFVVPIGGRNCNNWKTSVRFPLLALNYYTGRCSVAEHGWWHHICHCILVPYFCNIIQFRAHMSIAGNVHQHLYCIVSSSFLASLFYICPFCWKNSGVNWHGKQLWSLRGLAYPDLYRGERGKVIWIQPKCSWSSFTARLHKTNSGKQLNWRSEVYIPTVRYIRSPNGTLFLCKLFGSVFG